MNLLSSPLLRTETAEKYRPVILCDDGFIDFILCPKSKILKIKTTAFGGAGSASVLRTSDGG
jgi:hypothetical protein